MVRIIYRWRVQKTAESKFKSAWDKATTAIRDATRGAKGSVLLQSHQDPTEYITIARWDNLEDWQTFWEDSNRTEMRVMHALAERLSVEVYEEIKDHTV